MITYMWLLIHEMILDKLYYLKKTVPSQKAVVGESLSTPRVHDLIITPSLRQNGVAMSFGRDDDLIIASCVHWVTEIFSIYS